MHRDRRPAAQEKMRAVRRRPVFLTVSEAPRRLRGPWRESHLILVGATVALCGIDAGDWYIQPTDEPTCPRCRRARNLATTAMKGTR